MSEERITLDFPIEHDGAPSKRHECDPVQPSQVLRSGWPTRCGIALLPALYVINMPEQEGGTCRNSRKISQSAEVQRSRKHSLALPN